MMIKSGIRIGGLSISPAFDADALAYFATAGITNPDDKKTINSFVVGMKGLGYWSNMVCWPLRSTQNAGTGLTAYSLGGLATFNGTLTSPSGPTWGSDGIVFDGVNDGIDLPSGALGTGNTTTSFLAFLQPTGASLECVFGSGSLTGSPPVAQNYFHLKARGSGGDDFATMAFTDSSIAAGDTTFKSLFQGNTTLGFKGKNGGTVTSFSLSNTLNKVGDNSAIGYLAASSALPQYFTGTISAVVRINATPSTQLNSDVYSLYKTTLGTGLGLP
jgi:hypothetical protein